ncbi:MAG: ABC transporter permease [Bythopirellula sp.]|nr:ABC transporter permease [Bythopirellula sp.]
MSPLRYITASLWQYVRVHLAVAAGVAVATAVISGALLVGDSVRGSLRNLVLERLAGIDMVLVAEQPFRAELASEISHADSGTKLQQIAPLLLVPGSMSATNDKQTQHATQLSILGVTDDFWKLGSDNAAEPLTGDNAIITQAIADELHAEVGDEVLLRVAVPSNIPADSTLGEKADATTVRRLTIAAILNKGIARFSLQPTQLEPRNVFVPLATLQRLLDIPGKANVIAVSAKKPSPSPSQEYWGEKLRPKLDDFGLRVKEVSIGEPPVSRFVQISAERLVLPPYLVDVVQKTFADTQPQAVVTYLANTINLGDVKIPYSTVTGIDSTQSLGPLRDEAGEPVGLTDHEIALNDWAAERLSATVGDTITLKYYEPETTHGEFIERTTEPLTVKLIVPLKSADGQPTAAADEHFTPELPGVTDERSISDWDLPFPLVEKISQEDEDYWDEYRTTPKAFVSLALAKKLWSTRWGSISALRLPLTEGITADSVVTKLTENIDPAALGMKWLPVKAQGIAAARGTTAFEGLFLGFSFFLMASAIMLIALLFRLGAESRATEVGILSAIGWGTKRLRSIWLAEAGVVAIVGAMLGSIAGICYAAIMIHGLNTWWVAATVTPFLKLHVNPTSLAIGFAVGVIVSLVTIAWSLRKLTRLAPRQLLAGDTTDPRDVAQLALKPNRQWLPAVLIGAAVLVGIAAMFAGLRDEAQAGAFFGSGALVLTALLIWLRAKLRQPTFIVPRSLSLTGLAIRNARRSPSRTILSVGLAAVASFLIVALSAFRLAPTAGGTGDFDLMATADLPVFFDLNTPAGREDLGFSADDEKSLVEVAVCSFRVRGGEDASCLNLYQTTQPRVVGVPESFYAEDKFSWAAQAKTGAQSPWHLLGTALGEDANKRPIVPVVLDKNTAAYSLQLAGIGARFTIRDTFDQPITLEVVGLLAGSVLQGNVLMSEANFLRLYPDAAGQKLFLIRNRNSKLSNDELASLLETRLVDHGFDAVSATARLAEFMAVQNTYLSTFQSLGALGLLMGTVGLAVAQLRSVIERRSELALLRSTGFRRRRLAEMVLGENISLLFAGLGCGTLAALVATLPHWALQQADIPWGTLAILLAIVAMAGIAAGWLAVRAAIRAPLVAALRGD